MRFGGLFMALEVAAVPCLDKSPPLRLVRLHFRYLRGLERLRHLGNDWRRFYLLDRLGTRLQHAPTSQVVEVLDRRGGVGVDLAVEVFVPRVRMDELPDNLRLQRPCVLLEYALLGGHVVVVDRRQVIREVPGPRVLVPELDRAVELLLVMVRVDRQPDELGTVRMLDKAQAPVVPHGHPSRAYDRLAPSRPTEPVDLVLPALVAGVYEDPPRHPVFLPEEDES